MKHFVLYNSSGRIEALIVVSGPREMRAGVTPRPGLLEVEVEGLNIGAGAPDVRAFRKLIRDQKVPLPTSIALGKK